MILPAAMPTGSTLAFSAIAIESGLAALVVTLLAGSNLVWVGATLIVLGLASFVAQIRRTLARRLPRPPALPARDWSTWQTHAAFAWLLAAVGFGMVLSIGLAGQHRLTMMWVYGVAGLVGFLAQIVTGMQGRLVPFYAWYRAFAAKGSPPDVAANALPSTSFARPTFFLWLVGTLMLAWGLPTGNVVAIRVAAVSLLGGARDWSRLHRLYAATSQKLRRLGCRRLTPASCLQSPHSPAVASSVRRSMITEPLLVGVDDGVLAPSAHDANRGFDRGPGHVRQLLPGQCQWDENSAAIGTLELAAQLEEQTGETRLDAAAAQLGEPVGQLHEPDGQAEHQSTNERGLLFEQAEEHRPRNHDANRLFEGHGTRRKRPAIISRHGPQGVALAEHFQDHVPAARQHLEDFTRPDATV